MPIAVSPGISQIQSTALWPISTAAAAAGPTTWRRSLSRSAGQPAPMTAAHAAQEQQEQDDAHHAGLAQQREQQAVGIVEIAVGLAGAVVAERVVVSADPQERRALELLDRHPPQVVALAPDGPRRVVVGVRFALRLWN